MKFYADTSFLGNLYFDNQKFTENARHIRDRHQLVPIISPLVRLELRLATLWQQKQSAWSSFIHDVSAGKFIMLENNSFEPHFWGQAEALAIQKGREVQPDCLDALHVIYAINSGCTHFLSFDQNSRQRNFAEACGLKVLPARMSSKQIRR